MYAIKDLKERLAINKLAKKMNKDLTIKELERENKRLYEENWSFLIIVLIVVGGWVLSLVLSSCDFTSYYRLTDNIKIADFSDKQLQYYVSNVFYEEELSYMSFNGKYKDEKATITFALDTQEYTILDSADIFYKVDVYACATTTKQELYVEFVDTFLEIY